MHTWKHPADNPKGLLELELMYHRKLNTRKGMWGFWAREGSYEKVSGESMASRVVEDDSLCRFQS